MSTNRRARRRIGLLAALPLAASGSREVCVPTTAGAFCYDFVVEDVEMAAIAFLRDKGSADHSESWRSALAVEALWALGRRGNATHAAVRREFLCALKRNLTTAGCGSDGAWSAAGDATSTLKAARRTVEVGALLRGELPAPEEPGCARPAPEQAKLRACPLWAAYPEAWVGHWKGSETAPGPADAASWVRLGELWAGREEYDYAVAALLRALELGVEGHEAAASTDLHLASVFGAWGQTELAVALYGRIVATARSDLVAAAARLNAAMTVPPIVPADLDTARKRLRTDLEALAKSPRAWRDNLRLDPSALLRHVGRTLFHVAHQCRNEIDEQRFLARALTRVAPDLTYVAPRLSSSSPHPEEEEKKNTRREKKRPTRRVGLVSSYLSDHSIGKMLAEVVALLGSSHGFHVVAFHAQPAVPGDAVRAFIDANVAESVVLDRATDLEAARRAVEARDLDLLLYPDIGMDPWTYFLAFSRLAPVQCVWWGHPTTTGIPSVDFFLSLDTEVDDAPALYDEQLVRIHAVNTAPFVQIDLQRSTDERDVGLRLDRRRSLLSGAGLGPPADASGAVYLVLGRLFKLHPDFDPILLDLLHRDPNGTLVFVVEPQRALVDLAWRRLADAADRSPKRRSRESGESGSDALLRRVRFIDYWKYVEVLREATAVLDTYPYGGCLTALDAMSNGVPFATLPSSLERGRFAASIYGQMGYTDLVAGTPDDWAALSARLGTEPAFRARAATNLRDAYPRAHRPADVAAEWAGLFDRLTS